MQAIFPTPMGIRSKNKAVLGIEKLIGKRSCRLRCRCMSSILLTAIAEQFPD